MFYLDLMSLVFWGSLPCFQFMMIPLFNVTIKCLSSPNAVLWLIRLFFLISISHRVPIRSNPANIPSDTYMIFLMNSDDASNRLTFPGDCSVNLRQKKNTAVFEPPSFKLTVCRRFTSCH